MEHNGVKPPMPQLRLPADYAYNPLYFVPNSNAVSEGGIGEDDAVEPLHRLSHAVLPATTYLHRPLHFSPSPSNATPVRSHDNRSRSRESSLTRRSGELSPAAASARRQRRSMSMAASHAARRRRGHALTQEVAAWQRRSGKDCADQSSVATPSQEVTADTMHADLSTSILRPTRATQLREDYVLHYIEERDEAAQNIFFRPKGWPLSGAALNSPYRQHCTSSASPLRNGFLTPTRPENSSAASLPTPRFTKAAQLRQQSAVQLMEKLERCELEKAAEEALAHVVAESSSRRALMRLRTGAHSNSSSRFLAVQRSGGARGASTAMPFSGTQPSHHVPRWHHTSRTGSSGDTINGAGHRIRATSSASTHSSPREEWLSAASTCFDDREKTLNKQQHAAEATHAPSRGLVPDAPAPLPSSKYRSCRISKEALKAPRGELSSAKATEAMAVLPKPAACNGGERVPSRHHRRRRCSYAAQRDSESLSPVAIRDVRDTAHPSPSTAALASPPAAVHREREQRGIRTPPAVRDTETKMTSRGDAPLAQRATSLTPSHLRDGDDASSSSVSSIMFTVLSAPQDDTAGAHLPEARHDWQQVATQGSRMRESGDAADDSSLEFRSTDRSDCEHSASLLACLTPVAAVPPSAMRGAECSSFTSPDFSRVPSPTQASASVTSDEARVSAATAVAAPHERETKTSCAEREVERTPHAVGANASLAPRRPLEQALQGTREEPSARSSARCLGRRGVCPPPVDAYPAPAHTPHTPSTERSGDVSRRSLSQDPYHAGSSISSRSGEFEAQPPSQGESTGRSAQVAATTLPQTVRSEVAEGDSEKEPSDAAEVRHEGSALSTQSSFASIASYHTEVHVHIPAVVSDAADESLEAATSQTELLAFYRIAKPSSAAAESRLHRRAEHDWSLKSNVRASSQGDEASRAGDDKQVLRGHGGAVPSSPSWLLNASEGISSALCGLVPSAASGESDASRSVATDAYTVVAGGGRRVLAAWSLPVPPTNCTHMVAAKEARQRAAVEAGLSKLCTASEQPSRLLSGHISDSRIRQLTAAGVNSASSYQPRRERPVGKEALDSPRKPSMQESSRCTSAPPSAAEAPSSLVVASAENGTRDDARPEVVADKAEALAHGKTTDDAPSAAVSLADVAVLGTDRKGDVDAPSVQREGGYPRDATQSLATVTVAAASEKSSLSLVGAEQPAAIENALAESLPVKDAPASRAVLSRSSCVAIGRENRPTEKAMGSLALSVDSVPPQSHAESIRSVQETGVFTSDGTVGSRTAVVASLPHPLSDTHAGAAVAKAEGRQNDVVPCDGAEAAPAPCIATIRSATSSVRESAQPKEVSDIPLSVAAVQPEDATLHRSRSSSAEVGGANRAERTAVVGVNTPPSLSTWPRTVELAFATASFLTTEHGSFSLHFTEAEQSPRERSVYARQAASLSNGGGEELGEGVPHSHAPTPLHCRLPPQRRQATSPYEGVQLPDASAAEERKRDAPLAQAFSRSDTSTRCLCAASAEFQADVHVRAHTNERAEGTPAVPFGASVNGVSSMREQSRRAAAQDSVALDRSAPPSADATLELAAVCAPFSHDSPARPLSSSTSSSTHFLARSPSCSSQSSSSPTTPTATGRFMPSSLGRLDTPNQGDGGKVDFELRADDDCNGLLTGNAADANRSTFSRSTSCDLLEHAALVQLTEPTSTDAAVITTPFRPSSPVPGSEFSTTCSQISERITWSAGTWVDRERASASPDHAEAGVAESDLGVLRKGTRSAPSVPLTRVRAWMSAAAALGAYSCGSRGALCRVRAVPADITTAMSDRYESIETSLQFSSSSSFSTVLPPIGEEGCTDVRVLVVAGASSGKRQNEKGNDTHARSLQRVVPPSFLHNEGAAASVESQPLAHRALSASSSGRESGNRVHDSATATADSEYYFLSTIRGSTSPPGMSTYFGGAVAPTAPVARVTETAMSLMSDIESFEDIETPRSSVVSAVAAEQVSRTISPSPPTPSLHSRKTGARGDLLYAEVAVVNAEEARAAHALLTSSSAAIIARYRLVKLKVVQRIYRIYYDKWRWRIFQSASAVPPLHVTMGIQTSAPYQRSASVETDFADIESFHGSRSMSLSGDSPGVHVAVTAPPRDAQPLRSSPATPTPSPRLGEGESERGISVTWSPAPAFRLETFASASPPSPPQPSKYRTPTFSIPPAAPPTDGIGVRTKPAKLVDFGHPSEGPQRKTLHIASTPAANREMPMTLSGRGSPSPAPLRRQFAKKPAFNVTSPVLASLSTFAEYADRRHELLVDIHDGLEDDVRKMEERARQAVAHASAVTEACRAQEAECLEYIERLEDNIRDLHRAKQECAAELKGLQTSTERSRQDLEKELHDLRQAVEETRRQKLLAQEEQQHYEMLRDAAKRHYELIEAYLEEFTAKVEFHFHEAVASLQATAQERKRWADEQRALNEKRVREAALGAEKSDFSAFLCRATEDAERTGAAKPAEQRAAAVEPQLMRDLERDVAALAASVAARLQLIVEQESAAEAGLERLPLRITDESCDLIYSLCRTAAQSTLEGDQESWKRDQRDSCEAASVSHATRALGTLEVTVTHALLDLCAAAASASSTPSAKCRACPHESPTGAAAPLHIRAANASASSSVPPSSAGKALPPTPVQAPSLPGSSRRQSESVTFPERRLIDDFSCTTDAFATIFTPRK